jgi:uncharacterized membrane protein YfcA
VSVEIVIAGVAIAFAAAVCQSLTGFGFALVMTPLMAAVWEVKPAIPASIMLGTVSLLIQVIEIRGHVHVPRVTTLFLGFVGGVPLGVFLLEKLDADTLRIMVAIGVILASILVYRSPHAGASDTTRGRLAAGFLSGSIGSSTSLSGPPVVLYLMGRGLDVASFRATILALFLPTNIAMLIGFGVVGRITGDALLLFAAAAPAVVVGVFAGLWLRQHVQEERFRALVVAVLILTSILVLVSTAGLLG